MKITDNAPESAGGKDEIRDTEQGAVRPATEAPSVGKFTDAEALLKAYNDLQSEFTKRSQRLRELERENAVMKAEQSGNRAESDVVQDETGSAANEKTTDDSAGNGEDGTIASEVERFLSDNPEAGLYAEEIVRKAEIAGVTGSGFLDRAYLAVLKEQLAREKAKMTDDFILERAKNTRAVRDEIIRGYLADVYSAKGERLLTGSGGEVVVAPPIRPSSIAEAGKMAASVLKKK